MKYLCFLVTYLTISSAALSLEANTSDHRRIVGGDEANIEHFPYMGALLFEEKHHCGAALISNDTVVTAAHCVLCYIDRTDLLSVRVGSSQWNSGGQQIPVKKVIVHHKYQPVVLDYDIAVLKLNGRVNVANAVPIGLAAQDRQYKAGTPGVVSGWGRTEAGSYPETLRKVEVPVYDQTQCRDAYKNLNIITDTMICAGYKKGDKDFCNGDSGGPYVINGELVGIVSFSEKRCNFPGYPGVYASVPALHNWIESMLDLNII